MRLVLPFALSLATAVSARAQSGPESLTIRAAVAEALRANRELVALRQEYEAVRAIPAQERFLSPPMFETQIWGWPVTTFNPARTEMYMFMGEQEIPGRGKRAARALVGDRDAAIDRQRIVVRANEIVDEIRQVFTELALARATLALVDEQAAVLRDIADAATIRYASGHAGQHDTVKSVVELARLEGERITWARQARDAEARLNGVLGRRPDAPVEALGSSSPMATPSDAMGIALERHPALAMARAEIAREEAELARLRGERRPDFVVGGGYMLQPGGAGAWTARAGISWPNAPWSRGRLDAAIVAQEKRVDAARARVDAEAILVHQGVQAALVRLDAAQARVTLIDATVLPHVEHALDVARVAYSANRGEFADLLDTQRMLLSTQLEALAARADVERASSDLERAMGVLADAATAVQPELLEGKQ